MKPVEESEPRSSGPLAMCLAAALVCLALGCRGEGPASTDLTEPGNPAARQESVPLPGPAKPGPADLAVVPRLNDVAQESGIDFTYLHDPVEDRFLVPEIMGGGVAWIDYDLDGWIDLYVTNGCRIVPGGAGDGEHRNQLFRNLGRGEFTNVTGASGTGDDKYGQGVAVGDYTADGFPDIYVANYGPNVLLRNNGDGTFTDVTVEAGGVDDALWGSSVAMADLDGDGYLDIFVTNFLHNTLENNKVCNYDHGPGYCGPGSYLGDPDAVYLNQGDGTFVEMSEPLGFKRQDGFSKGLCLVIADLDDDLIPEIYVGNDMTPNYLYVRREAPPAEVAATSATPAVIYEDVAAYSGCAAGGEGEYEASMGIACEDFNHNGRFDLFLCHFHMAKNTLYTNHGNLQFSDDSRRSRIAATSYDNLCFGTVAFDFDRDGSMDLFNTTGNVLGPNYTPSEMPPQLLHNNGKGVFTDISTSVQGEYFQGKWLGRAVAGGDYDNDGDTDIAISHIDRPFALLRNDTEAPGHWLGLELRTPTRVPPVGGRVEVASGNLRVKRPVYAGASYHASHDPRLLFTLESVDEPAEVTVHWPSGRVDQFRLTGDAYWSVLEGYEPRKLQWD